MATVFRQTGSPYWYTAFFDGTGKRLRRSTKKTKRSDAILVAAEMERLARKRAEAGLDEKSRQIYSILEEAGVQALKGQLNETKGREFFNRIIEAATGSTVEIPTIEGWLRDWLLDKKGSRATTTHQRYEGVVDAFLNHLPDSKKTAPLPTLSISDIREFRDKLYAEGRSETTVNMAVKILRTPLNLARKHGVMIHNPAEAIEAIAPKSEEKSVFSLDQVAALLRTAPSDWQGLILAGFYTGARIGDLSNLKWSAIDLDRSTITIHQSKTNRPVTIPIHLELENWLRERSCRSENEVFIFPELAGKTASGRNGLSGQFRRIMSKAGIKTKRIAKRGKSGRNRYDLSFHSFRHSFNSAMANAGVPQEVRQKLTGHASKAVNDRYTHTEFEVLKNAVTMVPMLPADAK